MAFSKIDSPPSDAVRRQSEPNDSSSFEALAQQQGVRPVERFEDLLGGWPAEEVDDGFEEAVAGWRRQEREDSKRT